MKRLFSIIVLVVFLAGGDYVTAQGDLLITPRRLVFEGSKRSIDMNLANAGNDTATYAISIVQMRMTEDGQFETITEPDPGQMFADKYLRFFPRTVTLGPNEAQIVKVQLLRTTLPEPGEYRSHFYFRAVSKPIPMGESAPPSDSASIAILIKPVFGITIPVIIRNGAVSGKVAITDLKLRFLKDSVPNLSVTFTRSGNSSVYGNLAIYHITPQGKESRVGIANGIAVYTPNLKRTFQFNLDQAGADYTSGTLRAVFLAPSDVKPERYAEASLPLK